MYFLMSQTIGSALLNVLNTDMPAMAARARVAGEVGGRRRKEWKRTQGVSLGRASGHSSREHRRMCTCFAPFILTPVCANVATA